MTPLEQLAGLLAQRLRPGSSRADAADLVKREAALLDASQRAHLVDLVVDLMAPVAVTLSADQVTNLSSLVAAYRRAADGTDGDAEHDAALAVVWAVEGLVSA